MERAGQCRPALDCYFRSIPEKRGYRQRMIEPWNERGMFKITEQRMADQERIRTNATYSKSYKIVKVIKLL